MPEITTTDGVRLHVDDHAAAGGGAGGSGAGRPVVVLVAGFTAGAASWAFQVDALTAAGYRTVAVDRRNHGASQAVDHGQRIARHAQDVHEVLAAMELDDVVLVGGSMGASTAWSLLDLHGPAGVRGVVSVDQTPRMLNGPDWRHGFYGFDTSNAGTHFSEGPPDTGRGQGQERSAEAMQALVARLVASGTPLDGLFTRPTPALQRLLHDHAQQDWRDVVARSTVPVLLLAARNSQYWPCEHAAAAVAGNPLGRSVIIEDSGHAANIDRPDAVDAELLRFLADL